MLTHKPEKHDTTKTHHTPINLLDFIKGQPLEDDFIPLLTKHHKSIKTLLNKKIDNPEIKEAIFIVELNNFVVDLIKIASTCAEIELEVRKHRENIVTMREALQSYDSRGLAIMVGSFYRDARIYDEHFVIRRWLPTINHRPILPRLLFQPFLHNPELSNEENICNLIATFNIHNDFFKNFLNFLYGDGTEGEEFLGKTFEAISSDYKKIKSIIKEVSRIVPKPVSEQIAKKIESKSDSLEKIMAKYPAILYFATKDILNHLENATTTSLNPKPVQLCSPV